MIWIFAALVIVAACVAGALWLVRGRASRAPGSVPQPAAVAPAKAPQVAAVPEFFERVRCQVDGAMHGALPPYGKLHLEGTALVFEADSRVITAAGQGLADDSQGAPTVQSVGSLERGEFRFIIARERITRLEAAPAGQTGAVLHADAQVYLFDALGGRERELQAWLATAGVPGVPHA